MKTNSGSFSLTNLIIATLSSSNSSDDLQSIHEQFRDERNIWMQTSPLSPFSSSSESFNGLNFFPFDISYRYDGIISLHDKPQVIDHETTDGSRVSLFNYGNVSCNINGVDYNFILFKNIDLPEFAQFPEAFFISFKDPTSEAPISSTFSPGRYLKLNLPSSGNDVILDFNLALNPFESYNSNYSSLLISDANVIEAPIMTGERKYEDR